MSEPEDFEDFEDLVDTENLEIESENTEDVKRKIKIVEEELENLSDVEWGYAKRLLKYGLAAWVFGLASFFFSLVMYRGPEIIIGAPPLTFSLLIIAGAAPVLLSAFFIQRYRHEMTDLGKIRDQLLKKYEAMLVDNVEEDVG